MTKVKICGITNFEDAASSLKFGADALGFNFFRQSPRFIDVKMARQIIAGLPATFESVGVFVNESVEAVVDIARESGISMIQLHGDETPEYATRIRDLTALPVIKAFRVSHHFHVSDLLKFDVDAFLLDSYSPAEYGGTGERFDWAIAKGVAEISPNLYLAGGLDSSNVREAIRYVTPFAVDVCSGIEKSKGIKDHEKAAEFIRTVRETL